VPHFRFALPQRLSEALAGETKGLSFSSAIWGIGFPEVDDLAKLPKDASFVGLGRASKNFELLRRADRLVAIKTLSTTSAVANELPYLRDLRAAFLITLELTELELRPLAGCTKLEHLLLSYAPTVTDLGLLADLPQLRSLYLHHFPRLDLGTLLAIPSLQEFVFDGGFHRGAKVPSLAPLARLEGLQRLELRNVQAVDGSLAPLAVLQSFFVSHMRCETD
jgi:hypothetical protein